MSTLSLEESLQNLIGNTIKYSRAGGATGSILLITTDYNSSIWVWCYWEILYTGKILATADDDTTENERKIAVAAKQLEGKRVIRVELVPLIYDLHVYIEDGYELIINCESQPDGEDYPLKNWELSMKYLNIHYSVTCKLAVIKEKL